MLYREPKLLKSLPVPTITPLDRCVSVLYREPKLLKCGMAMIFASRPTSVSVLYREPKLLKFANERIQRRVGVGFSALP